MKFDSTWSSSPQGDRLFCQGRSSRGDRLFSSLLLNHWLAAPQLMKVNGTLTLSKLVRVLSQLNLSLPNFTYCLTYRLIKPSRPIFFHFYERDHCMLILVHVQSKTNGLHHRIWFIAVYSDTKQCTIEFNWVNFCCVFMIKYVYSISIQVLMIWWNVINEVRIRHSNLEVKWLLFLIWRRVKDLRKFLKLRDFSRLLLYMLRLS